MNLNSNETILILGEFSTFQLRLKKETRFVFTYTFFKDILYMSDYKPVLSKDGMTTE